MHHRARKFGASKYGFTRFIKGLLDLLTVRFLTRFGQRPLHVLGATGLVLLMLGSAGMLYLAVVWLLGYRPIGTRPLLIYSASLLIVGTQLVSLGILAELVTSYNIRAEDTYSIAETLEARKEGNRAREDAKNPRSCEPRSQTRQFVALLLITTATAQALGLALKLPTQLGANDISRWCTVWSLLERGTYAIDDCPWQSKTQDKVLRAAPFQKVAEGKTPVEHYYSSKPPLLAHDDRGGALSVPVRDEVPLDRVVKQERSPRLVEKPVEGAPGKTEKVLETPKEPVEWPVYVFYLKPMVVLLNVVPLWLMLVLYARLLDRVAGNDWAWFFSLFSAAMGTLLFAFDSTLNNHTIAAASAFFALYPFLRIWDDGVRSRWAFAAAGFFGAFCACNELPAALFGVLLFLAAPGAVPAADAALSSCRRRRFRAWRSWRRSTWRSASSGRSTRSSARSRTSTTAATGRRRWRWTTSTRRPSRTASTCST